MSRPRTVHTEPSSFDRVALDAVAAPLLLCDPKGSIVALNATLRALCGRGAESLAGQPAAALLAPTAHDGEFALQRAALDPLPVRATVHDVAGGRLWTLFDLSGERAASQRADHLDDLLNLAKEFGRIGVFERDMRTLAGQWDRHVFRIWGLPPSEQAPSYAESMRCIVPEDRDTMAAAFAELQRRCGDYAHQFSVRGDDGVLRRVLTLLRVTGDEQGVPVRTIGVMMDDTEAWQSAHAASEASAQLRLAIDMAGIVLWRRDMATNRFYYNDLAWKVLDIPARPDGLGAAELRSLIHPDDLPGVLDSAARSLAGSEPVDLEARYRRSDGTWRHVLTRRVMRRDAKGQPVEELGVSLDITDQLERTRRESELSRHLELAASAAGVAIWTYRFGEPHSNWNEQMYRLHGLATDVPAPDLKEYLNRFVHPDDRAALRNLIRGPAAAAGTVRELELRIVAADGAQRRVAVRGRIEQTGEASHVLGVMMDVTARRAAQAELTAAAERAALAARGAGVGTWEVDLQTGQAIWDDQMWHLRGLQPQPQPPDEAQRMAMVHPEDREALEREITASRGAGRMAQAEFRVRLPDGQWRWLATRSDGIADADGKPWRRIGINWDVTDAHNAQAVRQEAQLAQRESRAKSQFLARMSHELRTPLNAVLGCAQLLADDPSLVAPQGRDHLQRIKVAGRHLLAMVDDLLELSSLGSGTLDRKLTALQVAADSEPIPLAPPVAPVPAQSRRRLLYIEDNAVNAMIVGQLVSRRPDLRLDIAVDGASGVAMAIEHAPELVLVDMQLPDFDGHEVLRRLRLDPRTAGLRCVALSANAMPEDIAHALAAGFADYWTKPLDFKAFLAALDKQFGPAPQRAAAG